MIAHPPAPYIPIPMDTYNPVCDTSYPIGVGGSQMHWGVSNLLVEPDY